MSAPLSVVSVVVVSTVLALTAARPANAAAYPNTACAADPAWVSNPKPPEEISNQGKTFCDFYQFGWQWFLYLTTPSPASPDGDRNFEIQANFPMLQATGTASCTSNSSTPQFFVRTTKSDDPYQIFIIPERISQAGSSQATIYDRSGNVVFYQVRFSRNLCPPPPATGMLPVGTTELKTAWRQITPAEAPGYYTNQAIIKGVSDKPILLGLIGFHLFRTTALHPEGMWMTWEHKANAPDCLQPAPPPLSSWSFATNKCSQCLATSKTGPLACPDCNFNVAAKNPALTGPPSQVCRVYRAGTGPDDPNKDENLADVDALNAQLVGDGGILAKLPPSNPMAVFAYYFSDGGLWLSDAAKDPTAANQRGSLQLTNATMETTFQGDFKASGQGYVRTAAQNCFDCHTYVPRNTAKDDFSHIIDDLRGHGAQTSQGGEPGGTIIEPVASHRPAIAPAADAPAVGPSGSGAPQ